LNKIAVINGDIYTNGKFVKGSIFIHGSKIKKVILKNINPDKLKCYTVIDASESYVSYGFIDPHVHFRCPGQEYKEDWNSGSKAAVKGGFTYVIDMPNNNPAAVNSEVIIRKNETASKSNINYGFYLGLTDANSSSIGKIFSKIRSLKIPIYGIKVFLGSSTGDLLVKSSESIRKSLNTSIINLFHCEDEETLKNYNKIKYNSVKDHNDIRPPEAEENALKKISEASENNKRKSRIYICHVSSELEMKLITKLKEEGYNIISEITPHHLFFCLEEIEESNIYKVNPPIRHFNDVKYMRDCFDMGFFDIIGTDHAPHLLSEKQSSMPPSGFPGLETAFYAMYNLYERKIISLEMIFKLMTSGYEIFKIKKRGKLKKNYFADITVIRKTETIFKEELSETKSDFSPYNGLKVNCKIDTVVINGNILMKNGELQN
jgi:dihydroorotase